MTPLPAFALAATLLAGCLGPDYACYPDIEGRCGAEDTCRVAEICGPEATPQDAAAFCTAVLSTPDAATAAAQRVCTLRADACANGTPHAWCPNRAGPDAGL